MTASQRQLSARELWDLISESIAVYLKSYEVAEYCVGLGLAPAAEGEDPFSSKRLYVRPRLAKLSIDELYRLARRVAVDLGDDDLAAAVGQLGLRGVDGQLKNIIFASVGPKPRIVLKDAVNNVIDIVEHRESCLVYDRELSQPALTWGGLVEWWQASRPSADPARSLYQRLYRSLASPPEQLLFRTYCQRYRGEAGQEVPALLPQVYLHYDPYTRAERRQREGELKRERMDFLLLLPSGARVVLEVDGQQHYADDDGKASPRKYSEMVAEDRRIRLNGYEVYRFGGSELGRPDAQAELAAFFARLLAIHDG
jgi:hypothetical protein